MIAKINKTYINYEVYGDPSKPTLVLLHGIFSSLNLWKDLQTKFFKEHFYLVLVDLHEHGKSETNEEKLTIDIIARDLIELFEQLNLKKINLLGISFGGIISQKIAIETTDLLDKLILVDTFVDNDLQIFEKVALKTILNRNLITKAIETMGAKKALEITYKMLPYRVGKKWIPEEGYEFLKKDIKYFDTEGVIKLVESLYKLDLMKLEEITIKTLIIAGEHDYNKLLKEHTQILNKKISGPKRLEIIKGVGHAPNFEKPDEFNKLVLDFISG